MQKDPIKATNTPAIGIMQITMLAVQVKVISQATFIGYTVIVN